MINLLPPDLKSDYRYARRNTKALYLIVVCIVGLVGLAAVTAAGLLYLEQSAKAYTNEAKSLQQRLTEQKQAETEKQVAEVAGNLKLAVDVLSKEVLFSQLLKQLATVVPSNVVLTGITLEEFSGALNIQAGAQDYNSATQLHVNLADPANKIFAEADIVSINCSGSSESNYPCSVSVRALFASENPFLFINSKAR